MVIPTNSVSITASTKGAPGIKSNIAIPIIPFPGLIISFPGEGKVKVLEVECFSHNFAEDDLGKRDPFRNSISILVERIS